MLKQSYLTFLCVANVKSIRKASDELFLTPTAIKKQIDQIEKELDIKLFNRTVHGMALTESGKEYYHILTDTINIYNEKLKDLKINSQKNRTIYIMNALFQAHFLEDILISQINKSSNKINVTFNPFVGSKNVPVEFFKQLPLYSGGIFIECCNNLTKNYSFYPLTKIQLVLLTNISNPLYTKNELNLDDLRGYTINVLYSSYIKESEKIINDLTSYCTVKRLSYDFPFLVNKLPITDSKNLYLDISAWPPFNSNWKSIPLCNYTIQVGLYY